MRDAGPIIVALDGSELAEGALPYAVAVARALGQRIVLFTAWEGAEGEFGANFPALAQEVERRATEHYGSYLEGVRARLAAAGADVETLIRPGDAADEIPKAVEDTGARLLVLGTHGRSGIGRWLYGSTTNAVLRASHAPVLVAGPHALERSDGDVTLAHLAVPLDGSTHGEAALPVAAMLAQKLSARLSLVRAVRWAAQAYPYSLPDAYLPQVDEELDAGPKAYLRRIEATLKDTDGAQAPSPANIPEVTSYVVRGAVSEGLLEFVEKERVGLVVMTTHARAGLARMALGSTADRMTQGAAPVLLIRPGTDD